MSVKYFCNLLVLLTVTSFACAQEKSRADVWKKSSVVKTYKTAMKDKKYADARKAIDGAMGKFAEAKGDAQLYMLKMNALDEMIAQENRKIYLNQKPDTAQYFNLIYELYNTGLMCDSVEQEYILTKRSLGKKADEKYRSTAASKMISYRKKIITAGKFFYTKKNYKKAFEFFNIYSSSKTSEVFSAKMYKSELESETNSVEVASLALLSAYASSNHQGVINYLSEALKNKTLEDKTLEIGAKAFAALGDSVEMVNLLENGFYNYPAEEYFFLSLTKYYNDHGMFDKALTKAVKMTEMFPNKRDYLFVRGKEEVLLEQYENAKQTFAKCVEIKADDAESYSALGNIYLHEAHELYSHFNLTKNDKNYAKKKAEIDSAYKKAMENFENAKKFDEAKKSLWFDGLSEVYFKLNKGKELNGLDKYR